MAGSLDLFRQLSGLTIALNAQGASYDQCRFRCRLVKHAPVPKGMIPILRKGPAVKAHKIIRFGRFRIHVIIVSPHQVKTKSNWRYQDGHISAQRRENEGMGRSDGAWG
jgi:hypothetical protein